MLAILGSPSGARKGTLSCRRVRGCGKTLRSNSTVSSRRSWNCAQRANQGIVFFNNCDYSHPSFHQCLGVCTGNLTGNLMGITCRGGRRTASRTYRDKRSKMLMKCCAGGAFSTSWYTNSDEASSRSVCAFLTTLPHGVHANVRTEDNANRRCTNFQRNCNVCKH